MEIIEQALAEGRTTLSEYESKLILAEYDIPITAEILVDDRDQLAQACREVGFPLVLKGSSPDLAHKTEKSLVKLDIRNEDEAFVAFDEIRAKINSRGAVLVQELIADPRELMAGLTRDPQFGPCVMFGLGGIFTEVLRDVSFRMAPLQAIDAEGMMNDIQAGKILEDVRGLGPVNREVLARILTAVGRIGLENNVVKEIDVNPLKIRSGEPVAVDALVVLS